MENLSSITDRIQKLWTQATDKGVTESEAALFTAKVHELLARYNLDLSIVEQPTEEGCIEESVLSAGALKPWQTTLAVDVATLCLATCFQSTTYPQGRAVKHIMFVGSKANIAMAKALFSHLLQAVPRIRNEEKKAEGMTGNLRWGNSFDLGCSSRLRARIREMIAERKAGISATLTPQESTALVVVAEHALAKARSAMVTAHPRMRTHTVRSNYSSRDGYSAGYQAGGRISLGNQIQ
jgi:hypothetical protein